jgi:hypothetical protein
MPFKPPVVDYRGTDPMPQAPRGQPLLHLKFGFWSICCSALGLLLLWAAYETDKGRLLPKSTAGNVLGTWALVTLCLAGVTCLLGFMFDKRKGSAWWGCLTSVVLLIVWAISALRALSMVM